MAEVAIVANGLGKQYFIGRQQGVSPTYRRVLRNLFVSPWRRAGRLLRGQASAAADLDESIWALKDVSFEIKRGEVVGVIGYNGAGKSTLLKILSRITEPSTGFAEIHGRVGSLLEVGTGFQPELTGRQNTYLNGAILGMKKAEIDRKFDEIVAFADIEKFLDTPVKHYSTGMYIRLAFAVAAHLEPEILIVDEVLSVGDVQFQRKCLGKMQDISESQGRTVLFVSHNMDAIQRLCARCFLLQHGQLIAQGNATSIVAQYLSQHAFRARPQEWIDVSDFTRTGTGDARFAAVQYSSLNQAVGFHPHTKGPLEVVLAIESDAPITVGSVAITIYDTSGSKLVNADTISLGREITLRKGHNLVRLRIKSLYLNPGIYRIGLWLANRIHGVHDYLESAFEIEVVDFEAHGFGKKPPGDGVVACDFELLEVS